MKRSEEIEKQAKEFVDNYMQSCVDYRSLGYHQRKTILHVDLYKVEEVYEEAANWADKTMLDRACEWLRLRVSVDVPIETNENGEPLADSWIKAQMERAKAAEELIAEFRQAMEGGAE